MFPGNESVPTCCHEVEQEEEQEEEDEEEEEQEEEREGECFSEDRSGFGKKSNTIMLCRNRQAHALCVTAVPLHEHQTLFCYI